MKIEIIECLQKMEMGIKSIANQSPSFQIGPQVASGNIKMFSNTIPQKGNLKVILKLSGIWDNGKEYGITYKFMPIND